MNPRRKRVLEHTGKLVRAHRGRAGLTQNELAIMAKVSIRTISLIENGEVWPDALTLDDLARALRVKRGDLV